MSAGLQALDADTVPRADLTARLDRAEARMLRIEACLQENTGITRDIRDLLRGLELIGKAAKWIGLVATAFMAVYAAIWTMTHGGRPPT